VRVKGRGAKESRSSQRKSRENSGLKGGPQGKGKKKNKKPNWGYENESTCKNTGVAKLGIGLRTKTEELMGRRPDQVMSDLEKKLSYCLPFRGGV